MNKLMSSAEIMIWDMLVPVEKKPKVEKLTHRHELKNHHVERSPREKSLKAKLVDPQARSARRNAKEEKPKSLPAAEVMVKPHSKVKGINPQFFMVISSSTLGFMIGIMVSLLI